MTWHELPHILYAEIALDRAFDQIAELRERRYDDAHGAEENRFPPLEVDRPISRFNRLAYAEIEQKHRHAADKTADQAPCAADRLKSLSVKDHVEHYMSLGYDKKESMKRAASDRGISKSVVYAELLSDRK